MKVFISQKMGRKLSKEIEVARDRATKEIKAMYGEDTEIIDTFFKDSNGTPLELLGESIKLMSDADLVVFIYDWQEGRGCLVEYKVAELYGKKIIVLS